MQDLEKFWKLLAPPKPLLSYAGMTASAPMALGPALSPPPPQKFPLIIPAIAGLVLIGLIAFVLLKKKKPATLAPEHVQALLNAAAAQMAKPVPPKRRKS